MAVLFADLPVALDNAVEIARRCNVTLNLGKPVLPDFPIPEGMTETDYFYALAREGLEERLGQLYDTDGRGLRRDARSPTTPACSASSTSSPAWASRATS